MKSCNFGSNFLFTSLLFLLNYGSRITLVVNGQYAQNEPSNSQFQSPQYGPHNRNPWSQDYGTASSHLEFENSDSRCKNTLKNERLNLPEKVDVTTNYGKVTGRYVYLCDGPNVAPQDRPVEEGYSNRYGYRPYPKIYFNATAFFGIPYARPPVKEQSLRFKPPQPPLNWGVIDASKFKPPCTQSRNYTGKDRMIPFIDEDCLYLNIYSPYATTPIRNPYPVMIYIHGGNYDHGTGNIFPGHMLAATQQVVVITFNYRLGMLGFLATADNASAGNFGSLDQVQLIHWVRQNIRNFNGDPNLITLFGPGAGAASAGLLAISPLTRRYIKRVIAQSGAAVADWATITDPLYIKNMSLVAGLTFGCQSLAYSSYKLVECLKSRSYSEISLNDVKQDVGWLPWAPVPDFQTRSQDIQFMPFTPEEFLERGFPLHEPHLDAYLSGVTRDEGSAHLLEDEEIVRKSFFVTKDLFHRRVSQFIKVYNATLNPDAVISAIKFMYTPGADPNNETQIRQGLVDMYTDSWYTAGNDKMVRLMLKNRIKTYMYVLNYTLEGLQNPDWIGVSHDTEYLLASGAPFMDKLFYPSYLKLQDVVWTESDRNMSQFFMESWANFARTGNPTPRSLFNTILWESMSLNNLQYLPVNSTNFTTVMHRDFRLKQSQFWQEYIPSLVGKITPTWPPMFDAVEEELRIYQAAMWAVLAALIILIFIAALCSCLYCRAKRDRIGDAAVDLQFPDIATMANQYNAPSTRANSEISLSSRSRTDYPYSQKTPKKVNEKVITSGVRDKHTPV
ncbi:neuroligin-4: Y-linked-like protein [Leptotrombidium deliense]|uniref:Neuroligin-4: Y-linked-like protein n=1 Tax=Leptotrombidium deliense TaxID=299467 RepID=A0A443SIW1_9ACAR|nr:neuroligin-4: Y-linked-like protein [Leptotrombidium deliense]